MSVPSGDEVSRLLRQAVRLPAEERMAWLKHACHGDLQLLSAAKEELLRSNDETIDSEVQSKPTQRSINRRPPATEEERTVTLPADSLGTLAHFELVEKLGSGGFGTVYRARDTKLDRSVAIKVPRRGQLTETETEKFLREARTAAQLRHPNIVKVHEVGREGDRVFIVSDFIDGVTLAEFLQVRTLNFRQATELCIKLANALHEAHQQGVIHRDLKPGNIMIDHDGEPYLMDFGLAKREVGEVTMTQEGQIMGTPAYMSPEQARGESKRVDRRTDIYSLGVVLFELLTGERPFRGDTRMLIYQLLSEDAVSPRKLNEKVPKDLETICLRCLEKEPAKRFATADELASELDRYLAGLPIQSRQITRLDRAWRWCKRNPVVTGLSSALLLTLVVGLLVSSLLAIAANQESMRADERATYADQQKQLADENAAKADHRADEAEQMALYVQAESAVVQRRYRDAHRFNQQVLDRQPRWEYRHQLNRVADACRSERRLLAAIKTEVQPTMVSLLDEDRILYQVADKTVLYSFSKAGVMGQRDGMSQHVRGFLVGDDRLLLVNKGDVQLLRLPDLVPVKSYELDGEVQATELSLNKQRLVIIQSDGQTRLIAAKDLTEVARCQLEPADWISVSLSPLGDRLVCVAGSTYQIWDSSKSQVRQQELRGFHQTYFGPQNDQLFSLKHLRAPSTEIVIHRMRWKDGQLEPFGQPGKARNLWISGMCREVSLDFEARGGDLFDVEVGMMNDVAYTRFHTENLQRGIYYELDNLWPQGEGTVAFLGHSTPLGLIAMHCDQQLLVMRLSNLMAYGDDRVFGSLEYGTEFWTYDASRTHAFCYTKANGLQRINADGEIDGQFQLAIPQPAPGLMVSPWGMSVTPDGSKLALVWQENNDNGSMVALYGRKLIAVYELPLQGDRSELKYSQLVTCEDFVGVDGRLPRWIKLTADGRQIVYGVGDKIANMKDRDDEGASTDLAGVYRSVGYDVKSGERIWDIPTQQAMVFADEGKFAATYSITHPQPLQVYSIETGELVFALPQPMAVRNAALSDDGSKLYIGTTDNQLQCWQIDEQRSLWSIESAAAPIRVSEEDKMYLGFVPDSRLSGRLVVARLDNGRVVTTLSRNHWFAEGADFLGPQQTVSCLSDRHRIKLVRTMDKTEANQRLTEVLQPQADWKYAHLDAAEVWQRSQGLLQAARVLVQAEDYEGAQQTLLQAARLPNNETVWAQIRDLLARQRKWEEAYQASIQVPGHEQTYEHASLLFVSGRLDEYIKVRRTLMAEPIDAMPDWKIHGLLRVALCTPTETGLHDALKAFARRLRQAQQPWERAMVGRIAFRLGQYNRWEASVREEDGLPTTPILGALEAFRNEPNAENRQALETVVNAQAEHFAEGKKLFLGQYWHDYVERFAYWQEAVQALAG